MSLSNTVENEMLTDFLTRHPVLYLALSTADPGEAGASIAEPVGNGYARQLIPAVTISGNLLLNDDAVVFPMATGNQGTLTHSALFSAVTGGTFLGSGIFTSTPCPVGTVIIIPQDTAIVSLD